MRLKINFRKTISVLATVALIINSIAPYSVIFAQEVTPEPTPEATPTSSITSAESPTTTPVDLTGPTNISTTSTESPTTSPDMTPPETNTPSPEVVPTATDLVTSSPSDQPTTVQDPESNPTTQGPPSSNQPSSTPTLTPTFTSTVEPENSSVTTTVVQTSIIPQIVKDNSWFKLVTDKLDYAPDEMAIITGSNFEPNRTYSLTVSSTDEPAVSATSEIKSDGSGSFTFYYQLDGNYRPNYSVTVKDGEVGVASTSFTDSDWPGCGFQCNASDTTVTSLVLIDTATQLPITSCNANQTVNATIRGTFDTTSGADRKAVVIMGNIYQGASTIHQFKTNAVDGQCVTDTLPSKTSTDINLYSFQWMCGQTVTVQNLTLSWDTGSSTCTDFFNAPSCGNRTTKCYSGTSFSVSGPGTLVVHKTFTDGHPNAGIGINVTGPVPMSGTTNANGDAIFVPGTNGTYTAHAVEPTGYHESGNTCIDVTVSQGQTTNCTITDSPDTGSLTVIKHVVNDNGGTKEAKDFTVTVTGGIPSSFAGSELGTTVNVAANGVYSVSEGAITGYSPSYSADCSGTMPPAGNKICTITNDDIQPKLTITKTVNGGTAQVSDFNLFAGTTQFTSGIQKGINVGTYTITETGIQTSNYTTTFGGDCSSGSVTLGIGDVKTCTITNNVKLGSVNVIKYQDSNANGVYNDEPGLLGWTISLSGQTNKTNISDSNGLASFAGILPGNYILSETLESGWIQSNISCDNGTYSSTNQNFSLTVAPGTVTNCKIGNYQNARLTVAKQVISPTGGAVTNDLTSFAFSAAGHNFSLTNGTNQGFDLTPGTYNVSETANPNYTFNGCTNLTAGQITLTSGQTSTVTCTNQQKVATITVNKIIKNSSGGTVVDGHTFVAQLNGGTNQNFSVGNPTSYDVNPGGTYTISETIDNNYTNLGCKVASGADATGITLGSNEKITVTCINQQKPGSISGYKFMADGLTPISGWTVNLLSCISAYNSCSQTASTTTNGAGFYSFTNLIKGFYQVVELLDPNYTPVGSTSHNATIDAETNSLESTANNFDNFKNINITVCKKSDTDGDITTTTDQTNVPGWEIILYSNGQEVGDQRTGSDGCTTFSNLGPNNNYSASEVTQTGWRNIGDTTFDFSTPVDGQNQNHTFYNQRLGHIFIQKITNPGADSQSFAFTLSGGSLDRH